MKSLVKLDLKRVFRDKLFLVVCILAVVFAVITPALYAIIFGAMEEMDLITAEMISGFVTAKGQFFGAFSFGNNLGVIAPLLIGIILFKDTNFGTIRNKIIGGYSRTSIFMSNFVVCFTSLFGVVLAHALLTLVVCLPLFDYQTTPFGMADFWYLVESLFFQMLVYLFVAMFVSYLCTTKKSLGGVIVLYIAVVFGCSIVAGILQIALLAMEAMPEMESAVSVMDFFQRINVFNSSATIGLGDSYSAKDVWYYILTPTVLCAGLFGLGVLKFSKKDLK